MDLRAIKPAIGRGIGNINSPMYGLKQDYPTAFFNGLDTTGMTSYTGGPTYAPDHLGVLRSPGAGLPAIEGMRLATTLADGAVLGPELVADYSASKWLPQGSNLVSQDGTAVKITYVDNNLGAKLYLRSSNGFLTATPLIGERLLVGFKAKINMGEAKSTVFSDSSSKLFLNTTSLTNAFKDYSVEFTSNDFYPGWITISFRDLSAGEVVWITDISVKKVIPTYVSTDLAGAPILPSVEQPTRTGNTDFTEFIAGTTFKKYTRTNPATDMPGFLSEPARTNKCTCRKANPVDTSGLTKGGDAAAVLSVVDDTAALTAAGLIWICNSGKVYKLDNSAGVVSATATLSGNVGNTNPHTMSAYVRGSGTAVLRYGGTDLVVGLTTAGYTQRIGTWTPPSTANSIIVWCSAGSIVYFILPQLEEGPFCTSPICKLADGTDPLTAITRAGTVLTYPTAGKIRSNNMAFRMIVTPRATGQSGAHVYGTYTDANNYTALLMSPTSLTLRKRVEGVNTDATVSITHEAGVPLEIIGVRSIAYGMQLAARAYSGGAWGAWINGAAVTTAAAKADAVIASTYQLGALNSANQMTGNISLFDTLLLPDGIPDPIKYAKAKWGLPA